jgi:TetR/AcrR family transcriptional regulator, transcriptional repressor for nem operon
MAANTRDALLDLGTCLLLEAGYNATGVQAVLAAASVPKGSFYYHFDTKEAFALEAVDRYFALQSRVLTSALGGDGPWLERLERYFELLERDYETADFRRGCLLGTLGQETAASNDALRARIATAFDRWREAMTDALRSAQRGGEVDDALDPEEIAGFLLDAWEGAVLQAKVQRSARPLQRFRSIVFEGWLRR